jgi:hypothetical protein
MPLLARKLTRKAFKKHRDTGDGLGCVIPLVIVIFLAAFILKLFAWLDTPSPIPLLPSTDALMQVESIADVERYTNATVTEPFEIYDADLHVIGIYTEPNSYLPEGSVSLVYIRDGWRFVQIDYRPNTFIDNYEPGLKEYPYEELWLTDYHSGILATIWAFPSCLSSEVEGYPGKCEVSRQLFFELGSTLVSVSADGHHATEGELIGIAKSIADHQIMLTEPSNENLQ